MKDFMLKLNERLTQLLCGFHGHPYALMHREPDKLSLKCICGHQSPGWELNEVPPTPRFVNAQSRVALNHC